MEDQSGQNKAEQITLSMLSQYAYCPRRFALIHIEQIYDENIFTLEGSIGHERAHEEESSIVKGIRCERALPIYCDRLGLNGIADLVEFPSGVPYPVEYKRSFRGGRKAAEVQLCAQAFCLEEMFGCDVPVGAIYSIKSRKRIEIKLTSKLHEQTVEVINAVREALYHMATPPAVNDARCPKCSLLEACMPSVFYPTLTDVG